MNFFLAFFPKSFIYGRDQMSIIPTEGSSLFGRGEISLGGGGIFNNTGGISLSTPSTSSQALTSNSQKHVEDLNRYRILSGGDVDQRRKLVDQKLRQWLGETQKLRKEVDLSIKEFRMEASRSNGKFAEHAYTAMDRAMNGGIRSNEDLSGIDACSNLANAIVKHYFDTANQLMTLQKMNAEGKLEDMGKSVDEIYNTRMRELALLKETLTILRTQDSHNLDVETKQRQQRLNEETHRVDQYLKTLTLNDQREQTKLEAQLKEREQRYQQEKDERQFQADEKKADSEAKLKELQLKGQIALEEKKIQSQKTVEDHKIAAELTGKLAAEAGKVMKPPCIIM